MLTEANYVKLERGNDWGVAYFLPPGQARRGDERLGIPFKDGQLLRVRWPDGFETVVSVTLRSHSDTVSDCGHHYRVTYDLAGFVTRVHGIDMWLALDAVEVDKAMLPDVPGKAT